MGSLHLGDHIDASATVKDEVELRSAQGGGQRLWLHDSGRLLLSLSRSSVYLSMKNSLSANHFNTCETCTRMGG